MLQIWATRLHYLYLINTTDVFAWRLLKSVHDIIYRLKILAFVSSSLRLLLNQSERDMNLSLDQLRHSLFWLHGCHWQRINSQHELSHFHSYHYKWYLGICIIMHNAFSFIFFPSVQMRSRHSLHYWMVFAHDGVFITRSVPGTRAPLRMRQPTSTHPNREGFLYSHTECLIKCKQYILLQWNVFFSLLFIFQISQSQM